MNNKFIRVIPRLDIKNGMLIKGINLEGLRVLGDPYEFANYYYKNVADEICYVDNVATLYGTNNLSKFVSRTAHLFHGQSAVELDLLKILKECY
jgi:cyclase